MREVDTTRGRYRLSWQLSGSCGSVDCVDCGVGGLCCDSGDGV